MQSPLASSLALGLSTLVLLAGTSSHGISAQEPHQHSAEANFKLAARFAPYKMRGLLKSTSVSPRWIEGSDRFWYEYETSDGKRYWLVDPIAGTKTEIFDNDRIAAELTRITLDPWDAQHLPIRRIKFIDGDTLQFEVQSTQDEEQEDAEEKKEEEQEKKEDDMEEGGGRRGSQRPKKKVFHFEYKVGAKTLRELEDWEAPESQASWASISPDGKWVIFVRDYNLQMMSGEDYQKILDARRKANKAGPASAAGARGGRGGRGGRGAGATGGNSQAERMNKVEEDVEVVEFQLTEDGEEHYAYGGGGRGQIDTEREERKGWRKRASINWTKDSKRFALTRGDRRKVGNLWVIHSVGHKRPELETYKYDMPGDENVSQPEILIYDMQEEKMVKVKTEGWKDQRLSIYTERQFTYPDSEEPRRSYWLGDDSNTLYIRRMSRDQHRIDVMAADASTGEVKVLIEERLNTYVESQRLELLASGDMLWWSERDGWAHIYRYGPDGKLKNRLTEGPFSVRSIAGVDEEAGKVYFTANAREKGEDPYYQHLYSVGLDGANLQLLNAGNFDHRISMNEAKSYFVNNYSRIDSEPASAVISSHGRKIMDLEKADFSQLFATGYKFPESFKVKAADGITDIYGNIYKPFDFDASKSYPIIAYVYPGPQTESVAKAFSTSASQVALAQFGFVVITVGNRGGNPARSKWYHNYGYGNLRDYGLADKKAAIEQLGDRFDFVDTTRVGIYGHSGGGFMSTAAMLVYPEFFHVAVSQAGNHNNDIYNANWSEKHHGIKEVTDDKGEVDFEFSIAKNSDLAKNLKGNLLLVHGDVDNNVHPAGTMRVVDALIKANKRFDFYLLPGQRHGFGSAGDYWFWISSEYFVKHLLGHERSAVDIRELNAERAQSR